MSAESKRGRIPFLTPRLGHLQQRLWDSDPQWFGWRSRLGNGISSFRYWLWFLTGGWRV